MRRGIFYFLFITFCFLYSCEKPSAEIEITQESIYPRYREKASPADNKVVAVNPSPLLWKRVVAENKKVKYQVKLYQRGSKDTITSPLIPWCMYHPHQQLKAGKWNWKYAVHENDSVYWSDVYSFVVEKDTHSFVPPSIDTLLLKSFSPHPRLYVDQEHIKQFRIDKTHSTEAKIIVEAAEKALTLPIPKEEPVRYRETKGLEGFELEMMYVYMYHGFGDKVKKPIEDMVLAYLLTGEKKYVDRAIRHALAITKMDPKGHATSEDFNSASVMEAMAMVFDNAYEYLSEDEKTSLIAAIRIRGNAFFNQMVNNFESRTMDNHGWQHILRRFFLTAYATLGDIPEANDWLAYCYETWCCRFPILGGTDGGAHDGNGYFPVNFETFGYMPFYLSRITGYNFFDIPYLQNLPWYLIYSFPPQAESTQFGDEHEYLNSRPQRYIGFSDLLAREYQNPYMNTYLEELIEGDYSKLNNDNMFRIYRLLTDKKRPIESKSIGKDVPQSRLFQDIGVAVMRNNIANPHNDIMTSFISSPYGSSGHAHANHNSFSLNINGQKMLGSSGYYSHFSDKHNLMHYRNSLGHNTVVADSLSQRIGEEGFGWIARFEDTPDFTYVLGDASKAYGSVISDFWLNRMQQVDIEPTPQYGFGDAGVTHFRRHFVFLRPSYIVIYDELKANKPVSWTWMLHSYYQIKTNEGSFNFVCYNRTGSININLYSYQALNSKIHSQFASPALNWRDLTDDKNQPLIFKNHWHLGVSNKEKTTDIRFLSIIEVNANGKSGTKNRLVQTNNERQQFLLDNWTIEAELNTKNEPSFSIINNKTQDAIRYNLNDGKYKKSTFIRYNGVGKELIDSLPISMQ